MASFHLEAKVGEIAEKVLLPGDPLRAKYVAENFLEDIQCYNRVRNMFGYTGYYKGKRVSIQGTGMGMGSCSIYINELIRTYGTKTLIRVGTCGAIQEDLDLGQVVIATGACGDNSANMLYFEGKQFAATPDFDLLYEAYNVSKEHHIKVIPGTIFSTDSFYDDVPNRWQRWIEHGVIGVEMESQALYTIAKKHKVKALSILTVSDNIITGAAASNQDREQSFMDMMKIALEV
jgi:purine-nucleoside phosphorylase